MKGAACAIYDGCAQSACSKSTVQLEVYSPVTDGFASGIRKAQSVRAFAPRSCVVTILRKKLALSRCDQSFASDLTKASYAARAGRDGEISC